MDRYLKKAPYDDERRRLKATSRRWHDNYRKWLICRWCGKQLTGRRTSWCSDGCLAEYEIRSSSSAAAWHVYKRDAGVCAECGLDCVEFKRVARRMLRRSKTGWGGDVDEQVGEFARTWINDRRAEGWDWRTLCTGRRCWEVDHVVSVEDGGGCCGLDGLQTLCQPCHKAKNARQARRRARKNRRARLARRATNRTRASHGKT
jgi:5-methylcytosine-specific restriction endonuclease McrA